MKPATPDQIKAVVREFMLEADMETVGVSNIAFIQGYVTRTLARQQLLVAPEVLAAVLSEIERGV